MQENVAVDSYYFRQINLPFRRKADIIHALMRFIAAQPSAVLRGGAFDEQFIAESSDPPCLRDQAAADPWLAEHINRLFWVCHELGLLQYQYPYPHRGQTYLPTRGGRMIARAPRWLAVGFNAVAYLVAIAADPIKHFKRVRNIVTVLTTALLWWHQRDLSAFVLAVSIGAGIVSTWIVSFFGGTGDTDSV
jgi:hypothetical protein